MKCRYNKEKILQKYCPKYLIAEKENKRFTCPKNNERCKFFIKIRESFDSNYKRGK